MAQYHKDYYEGILQLRNADSIVIQFIKEFLKKKKTFITKQIKVKNGFNYFVTNQRVLQNLGKKLKNNYSGILKVNPKLYTRDRQTSKDIYRVNVYFELTKCRVGQIVDVRGDKVKITKIGRKIFGKNLKDGSKVVVDIKEMK